MKVEGRIIRLMRHAETEANVARIIAGKTDVALTSEGREAAVRLGKKLEMHPKTVVYSGLMQRHVYTAELVSNRPRSQIIRTGLLNERGYGLAEDKELNQKLMDFWWTDHNVRTDAQPFKGMVRDRYLLYEREKFDQRLLRRHPDRPVLVVSSEDKLVTWLGRKEIERFLNLAWVDLAGPKGTPLHKLEIVYASEGVLFKASA